MISRTVFLVCVSVALLNLSTSAQSPVAQPPASTQPYCEAISHDIEHGDALTNACEFAQSLLQKLPNVICDQRTERYRAKLTAKGMSKAKPQDVVTAKVRYLEGSELYSEFMINGKADPAMLRKGAWAAGEYGATIGFIFSEQSSAGFRFTGEKALGSRTAFVFEFTVDGKNNHEWALDAYRSKKIYPGIHGRLWLDTAKGGIMQTEIEPSEVGDFACKQLSITTNYDVIQLGDGTSFVLPTGSVSLCCNPRRRLCSRNVVSFQNCHKFAAKSRILTSTGENENPQ